MISEILLKTRTRDSVNVYTRFGKGFVDLETHRYYEEIPEGREASEFGEMEICLRKDQSGEIFSTAHDVEDAPYTYTQVFPDPRNVTEYIVSANVSLEYPVVRANLDVYPEYKSTNTYSQGDIVVYNGYTFVSDIDENTGYQPDIYGWTLLRPCKETRDPNWMSLQEIEEAGIYGD